MGFTLDLRFARAFARVIAFSPPFFARRPQSAVALVASQPMHAISTSLPFSIHHHPSLRPRSPGRRRSLSFGPENRDSNGGRMQWRAEGLTAFQPSATRWVREKICHRGNGPPHRSYAPGFQPSPIFLIVTQPFGLGWYAPGPSALNTNPQSKSRFQVHVECRMLSRAPGLPRSFNEASAA